MTWLLILVLLLLLIAAMPGWPYSRGWGYYPSGVLGVLLLLLIIVILAGFL